jgi:hypothetical protein
MPGVLPARISAPAPNPPEEVVKVARTTVRRVVNFSYAAVNVYPQIPDYTPGSNEILLDVNIIPFAPQYFANHGVVCAVMGTYTYLVIDPSKIDTDGFTIGRLPIDGNPVVQSLDATDFQPQMIQSPNQQTPQPLQDVIDIPDISIKP